jgi:hypothetical protein
VHDCPQSSFLLQGSFECGLVQLFSAVAIVELRQSATQGGFTAILLCRRRKIFLQLIEYE